MLKYNILIAIRNLKKHKFYSAVNISGLAIATACCLFISIFIADEFSYDKHFENHQNIYRLSSHIRFNGNDLKFASSPAPIKAAMKDDVPEVLESGRFRDRGPILFRKGDQYTKQESVAYADADILNIFKLDFIYGGQANSLKDPNSLLLSRSASEKFFGYQNPVGQSIQSAAGERYRIDGVYNDLPVNSHFHFHVLLSMEGEQSSKSDEWLSNDYKNYFLLRRGASVAAVNEKLPTVLKNYIAPRLKKAASIDYDEFIQSGSFISYKLVPVTDIHLHSNLQFEIEANGNMNDIFVFMTIGLIVLFLACFNFMNLATAKSASRAKEVGMRKVMGSLKRSLIVQFLTESTLISIFAFIVAVVILHLGLPYFNDFTGKNVSNPLFGPFGLWPFVLAASILVGVLAGMYPAFFLSSFRPIKVLKGQISLGRKSNLFRNALVVLQFSISILMIMGTGIVYKQMIYSQSKSLGYDQKKVLLLDNTYTLGDGIESFKNELASDPEIMSLTSTYFFPTREARSDHTYNREEESGVDNAVNMQTWHIDDQYIQTLGMKIIKGRNFDRHFTSDSSAVILNETAVKEIGYTHAVGKRLRRVGEEGKFDIIGVVEDFYFDSFKQKVKPLVFVLGANTTSLALNYNSKDPMELVSRIENIWENHASGHPFEYSFMDQEFDAKFKKDRKLGMILTLFAILAIFIASLGLFALSSFIAQQRKKEIGIRKVLGASVSNIIQLLFSNFSKLLIFSAILATPTGYYLMNRWLDDFAYRTDIGILMIIFSCLAVFIIAWITVGSQTIRVAQVNPTENLRSE